VGNPSIAGQSDVPGLDLRLASEVVESCGTEP
jgi:hypothetical protein